MATEVEIVRAPALLTLEDLAARIAAPLERAGAERAIAFGSYARGEADGYADLDLLVVLDTTRPPLERAGELAELYAAIPVGLDLYVFTPDEYRRGTERGLGLFDALARDGVVIHEARRE